jgi:hypothetical protein
MLPPAPALALVVELIGLEVLGEEKVPAGCLGGVGVGDKDCLLRPNIACSGHLDMRAQADILSALRTDTPCRAYRNSLEATEMSELTLLRGSIERRSTTVPP